MKFIIAEILIFSVLWVLIGLVMAVDCRAQDTNGVDLLPPPVTNSVIANLLARRGTNILTVQIYHGYRLEGILASENMRYFGQIGWFPNGWGNGGTNQNDCPQTMYFRPCGSAYESNGCIYGIVLKPVSLCNTTSIPWAGGLPSTNL